MAEQNINSKPVIDEIDENTALFVSDKDKLRKVMLYTLAKYLGSESIAELNQAIGNEELETEEKTIMGAINEIARNKISENDLKNFVITNGIGGTTKTINVMDNNINNCKIDGITDDYDAITAIMDYVNSTTEPITVVFPYTGSSMNISDTIYIRRSNVTFEIFCDIKFTKSIFTSEESMNVFEIGYSRISRTPIENINFIGHGITIDCNGASIGLVQESHSQVEQGNGIIFSRVLGGTLKGVHVKNALCDGIKIYNSKNILVENCETSETCIDNGLTVMGLPLFTTDWTFDEYADRCRNNVIVKNCVSHNNEDAGFTAAVCYDVTFENCLSYENGNVGGFNAGGAFSAESLSMESYFEVSTDYDMDIKFIKCKALNNNNYAFYSDVKGVLIDNCYVDKVVQNDSATYGRNLRGGNGFYDNYFKGKQTIINTVFKNCGSNIISCINSGNNETTLILDNITFENNKKGIYVSGITYVMIKNINAYNCPLPIYTTDGNCAKCIELNGASFIKSTGMYLGNAEMLLVSDLHANIADGTTIAMNLQKAESGIIKGITIDKTEDNTTNLKGIFIYNTCGSSLKVDENSYLTTAETLVHDQRTTE